MTNIKTPEQVAADAVTNRIAQTIPLDEDAQNFWINQIREAINTDRAQRAANPHTLDRFLQVYEGYEGELDHLVHMWESGQYIPDRIAELTAHWEEAVNDGRAPGEPMVHASDYARLSVDDWSAGLSWDEAEEIARLIDWKEVYA